MLSKNSLQFISENSFSIFLEPHGREYEFLSLVHNLPAKIQALQVRVWQ